MNYCLLAPAGSIGWSSVLKLKAAAAICFVLQLRSNHEGLWRMGSPVCVAALWVMLLTIPSLQLKLKLMQTQLDPRVQKHVLEFKRL